MKYFFPFGLYVTFFIMLIEFYTLISWTKFVKKSKWENYYYRIPWFISCLMFIILIYNYFIRFDDHIYGTVEKVLILFCNLWFLPKILIAPFILIKDIIRFFIEIYKVISKKIRKEVILKDNPIDDKRRNFVKNVGWGLAAVPYVILANGAARTTYNFKIYEAEVPLDKISDSLDGLKIVQISDIHAGSFITQKPFSTACRMINYLKPDILFLTGDFVNFQPEEMDLILPDLRTLRAEYGVYACLGNHDHYMTNDEHERLINIIRDTDIDLLINDNRTIDIKNDTLQLIATDNSSWKHNFANFDKALTGTIPELTSILLCHDPTNWDKSVRRKLPIDLMLSGHTHGGQVGIELLGQYLNPVRIIYKQWAGLYKDKNQYLYVNRGLGTVGPTLRVGMPPEISLIRLKKPKNMALSDGI
jgi:uncharacterized protein